MKNRIVIIFALLMLLLSVNTAFAALTEQYDKGQVDYEVGVIRVIGYGAPPANASETVAPLLAMRAAKVDAYRNALEVIDNVRVSSATDVESMMVTSDLVKTSVQGYIKGGQFEAPNYDARGICTITLVLPLSGQNGLASLMLNTVKSKPAAPVLPMPEALPMQTPEQAPYTGIVIDARTVGVKPALYPQLFDADGYLLYGPTMVNTQQAEFTTMVAYSRTLEKAAAMPRVGSNPLKLSATSAIKASNGDTTDIILGSDASKAFRQATSQSDILAKSAIVIVIN